MGRMAEHPNVIGYYSSGITSDGEPYVVFELCDDDSGASLDGAGPVPWTRAVDIGIRLAGALETAHRWEIFHGSVNPRNIHVSSFGVPMLGGFVDTGATDEASGFLAPEIKAGAAPSASA